MTASKDNAPVEVDIDPAVFQDFADLEKEFAKVELDALRRKEHALKPLYSKRATLSSRIPDFWPQVLLSGPQEFQSILDESSAETVMAIKTVTVERHEITSATEGEPRSLRFTFEFDANDWFEDGRVVKEFRWVEAVGGLVSTPVTFRWKKKGRKANGGLLDLAVELWRAEEAVRLKDGGSGVDLGVVERENLWQFEKLRERLVKLEEDEMAAPPGWLDWFGYRGPVGVRKEKGGGDGEMDEEDEDDMLAVEIFPAGEEVAIALAEDLWPNVMDYFMAAQEEPDMDDFDGLDSDEDESAADDDIPELIPVEEDRPAKRQKKA